MEELRDAVLIHPGDKLLISYCFGSPPQLGGNSQSEGERQARRSRHWLLLITPQPGNLQTPLSLSLGPSNPHNSAALARGDTANGPHFSRSQHPAQLLRLFRTSPASTSLLQAAHKPRDPSSPETLTNTPPLKPLLRRFLLMPSCSTKCSPCHPPEPLDSSSLSPSQAGPWSPRRTRLTPRPL